MSEVAAVMETARAAKASGAGWIAVRTQHRRERTALEYAQAAGFDVYLPQVLTFQVDRVNRRSAVKLQVLRPLFPQYMMARLDVRIDPWWQLNSCVGVAGIVCPGKQPVYLPAGFVEAIQGRQYERFGIPPKLKPGDEVHVTAGPWRDWIAKIEKFDSRDRITAALPLFGGSARIQLREGQYVVQS